MTSETRVVVIRHGQSRAQESEILSGHDTCTGLTGLGRRQVGALRDRLTTTHELGVGRCGVHEHPAPGS